MAIWMPATGSMGEAITQFCDVGWVGGKQEHREHNYLAVLRTITRTPKTKIKTAVPWPVPSTLRHSPAGRSQRQSVPSGEFSGPYSGGRGSVRACGAVAARTEPRPPE